MPTSGEILLVTGATGLVGSNLCLAAARAGYRVRGLARSDTGTGRLRAQGVEIVIGDVTDAKSLQRAVDGASFIAHTAAVLGGSWSKATPEDFQVVNYNGVCNVLDAAQLCGVRRVAHIDSFVVLDWSRTITERSSIVGIAESDSPYLTSKRSAVYKALHRASLGQDIVFITPADIYGPGPFTDRALDPTAFNSTLVQAINGALTRYVRFPLLWVFIDDVVAITLASLERGSRGERYLALGCVEDACSLAEFCNRGAAIAGAVNRVEETEPEASDMDIGTMARYMSRTFANPAFDSTATETALGVHPTRLVTGLERTVSWLRAKGRI